MDKREGMRFCSKCKSEKNFIEGAFRYSRDWIQIYKKWICLSCFLAIAGGNKKIQEKAKSRLRKRIPPKSVWFKQNFQMIEITKTIRLEKEWHREDLGSYFEKYKIPKAKMSSFELYWLGIRRKPKKKQPIWREFKSKDEGILDETYLSLRNKYKNKAITSIR